ncbi:hypothetical protein QA596_02155 [Balneolales bacterium ANBcel1]|nr:hypothetical protein [Balneolales bacterium ANBcel1]
MTHKISLSTLILTLTTTLLLLNACSDGHDHHYAPIGIVLSVDGDMLASQEQHTITYADGEAISIPAGATTETITVQFLSDDSTPFTPEHSGYSLRYDIENTDILEVAHPVDNNSWALRLTGSQAGTTTIQFELWHDGHSDFTSAAFQVAVHEE